MSLLASLQQKGDGWYCQFLYHGKRHTCSLPPEHGGATPAIALTAFARPEDRSRSLRAGFQLHLPKPVEIGELLASIVNLMN
jgi:CheY-like chemotaxis protein